MDTQLQALCSSVDRLNGIVTPLSDEQLEGQAYPSKWSVADVLSHIGSSAQIMQRRLDDGLRGEASPDGFAPQVWNEWNAKSPRAKADDALAADRALVDRISSLTDDERERFSFEMGPMRFDYAGLLGLRLNEHVMHTWDVEVALDGTATLANGVELVVDNLGLIARFTAKPTGDDREIVVRTTDPERTFLITLSPDSVKLSAGDGQSPDLTMPSEAFARLVYGRLDPDHTPALSADNGATSALEELRKVFPGP